MASSNKEAPSPNEKVPAPEEQRPAPEEQAPLPNEESPSPKENAPPPVEPLPLDHIPITQVDPTPEVASHVESLSPDHIPISQADPNSKVDSEADSEYVPDDCSSHHEEIIHPKEEDMFVTTFPRSALDKKVEDFVDTVEELNEHLEILKLGARLKRDEDFERENKENKFSEDQKTYLKNEKDFKLFNIWRQSKFLWRQSKYLKGSLLSACLAGIIQGWTQSAMNGANVGVIVDFNIHYKKDDPLRSTGDLWLFGVLNAIPFLAGGLLAPLISDPLQEHLLGRRGAMAVACVFSIAATVGQCFSKNTAQLVGCRLITGLTLAAKASAAPLLTAEVSPDHIRGNLLSTWQLSDAFGIFLGFASNLAIQNLKAPEKTVWRVQTAMVLIPTVALLFVVYLVPESPRFLMKRGKYAKALESFTFLRPAPVSAVTAARDFAYAHFQLQRECRNEESRRSAKDKPTEQSNLAPPPEHGDNKDPEKAEDTSGPTALYLISKTSSLRRLRQTFRDARSRRALVCASTAMIAQQLTGINTIAFLSATLLTDKGASDRDGAWVGFGLGLVNFVFGLPSFWLLENVGRATMLLLGFPPMFLFMLVLAFGFKTGEDSGVRAPLVGVFGIFFMIAYSPTAGPAPFAISAEVFPLVVREVGHSIAVAVNFVGLGVILLIFPSLSDAMGGYTESLALFAALNVVAFMLCFLFVPETKGRSLEELQFIFDRPTKEHIEYRVTVVTPWLAKTYLAPTAVKLHLWDSKKLEDDPPGKLIQFQSWKRKEKPKTASPDSPTDEAPGVVGKTACSDKPTDAAPAVLSKRIEEDEEAN